MEQIVQHAEIIELKKKASELSIALKAVATEMYHLTNVERPRLLDIYDDHFGALEIERQRTALKSADLFRRVELLQIKASRGEEITPEIVKLVNTIVDKEYQRLHQRFRDAFDVTQEERNTAAKEQAINSSENLVAMYRILAKKLHPDVGDVTEETSDVWHNVQTAYQKGDTAALQTMLTLVLDTSVDTETNTWGVEQWQHNVQELESRLRLEQRNLDRIKAQEPLVIANELTSESWISRHKIDLERDIAARKREIAENTIRYRDLVGNNEPLPDERTKEQQSFDEDFMENTYFGGR